MPPSHASRIVGALTAMAVSAPAVAWAKSDVCLSPIDGATCAGVFSMVSLSYIVMAGPVMACALLILKPRFVSTRAWALSLMATPLITYVLSMLGFTLAHATGLLRYPHDISPFFYMDWTVVVFVFLGSALATLAIARRWASSAPTAQTA